ncbi:hypothetical protein ACIP27_29310, partial [Streptomyces hydrogenans]|uniref:hypothetical protein n=1 Tax=Streptomyces hydrogenans TaxID=1873719 RepID=UPI00381A1A88
MHTVPRARLRAMALGLLGSAPEADRAVRTTERALASYGPGPRARLGGGAEQSEGHRPQPGARDGVHVSRRV